MPSENLTDQVALKAADEEPAQQMPPDQINQRDQLPSLSISSAAVFSQTVFSGHLHPLTIILGLWKASRAIIPIIPLILFGNRWFGWFALVMTFAGTVLTVLIRYFSFSYRIEGHELITEEGIIGRKQRNIPLERIQEIRIEQGVLHRLLDVVDARIETGSGGGAEASLSVLSRAEAERLRRVVFERAALIKTGKQTSEAGTSAELFPVKNAERVLRRLSLKELILAGLTTNHLLSALVLAGAIWNFADDILPDNFYQRAAETITESSQQLLMKGLLATIVLALIFVFGVLLIGIFFSIAGSVLLFYGFTFSLRGEDLHRRYGLLTRRASSLPRRRIQILKIEESALRRLFGLSVLRADTAGSKRENEDNNDGRDVLMPILPIRDVDQLLASVFPDYAAEERDWRRVSRMSIRRGTIKGTLFSLLLASVLVWLGREWLSVLSLAIAPLAYLISAANYRTLGYYISENYFCSRIGWFGRSTYIVPINKIQAAEIRQTPFDRRLGLATLIIDTAGQAYTEGGPQIGNLPIDEARKLARSLSQQASVSRFKW